MLKTSFNKSSFLFLFTFIFGGSVIVDNSISTSALHSLYLAISEYFNIAFRVWFIYQKPSPKGSLLVRRYAYKYAKLNSNAAESAVVLLFTRNIKSLSTASFFDNSSFFLLKSITVYIFHPIYIVTSNDNMPTITPM